MNVLIEPAELIGRDTAVPTRRERRGARASGFVPREDVLTPPVPREGTITRSALVRRLLADRSPVVVLSAPPGYGKTSLLRQWSAADARPFAWLSLRSVPDDAASLLTYVVVALQRLEPVDVGPLPAPRQAADKPGIEGVEVSDRLLTTVLPRLGRVLARRKRPFVLVLDDVDGVRSPDSVELVRVLAEHVPAGSQLVLAGASVPPLLSGRLRAEGRLAVLSGADLAVSREEGARLLAAAGLRLPRACAAELVAATEGWAAGLYLAGLAIEQDGGDAAAVSRFVGDEQALADYLREELLQQLPADEQDFMIRTSILTQLDAATCDAVLARRGSGDVLRALAQRNLFVTAVEGEPGHYRYHRLVAAMLRGELHQRQPQLEDELHRRASAHRVRRGELDEAIGHALAGGDVERAGELLWQCAPARLASGRRADLERWLGVVPPAQVLATPWLCLVAAWCAVETGGQSGPWRAAAEQGACGYPDDRRRRVDSALATLAATVAAEGLEAMREDARLAQTLQEPEDGWRPLATFLEGAAAHLLGDRAGARRLLENASYLADALGLASPRALALAQLGLLDVEQQEWSRAEARIRRARELLQENDLDAVATMAPVECTWSLVLARQGDGDRARAVARQARRMVAAVSDIAPWFAVQARVVLARTYLLLGDSAAARTLLSEAQRMLPAVPDAPVLRDWTEECWRGVEAMPVTPLQGPSSLTTAELRVLQYLPSYLSFEDIGRRLSLSRNTVKTQAIAAYRKLGVTSRAEAVERARALGLVGWSPEEQVPVIRHG